MGDLLKLYGAAQDNYEREFKELYRKYKNETDIVKKKELSIELAKKRNEMSTLLLDASDACKMSATNMYKNKSKMN
jgi:hypothetical protein